MQQILPARQRMLKKVVKLFNYLMARPAKEVERDNKKKSRG